MLMFQQAVNEALMICFNLKAEEDAHALASRLTVERQDAEYRFQCQQAGVAP